MVIDDSDPIIVDGHRLLRAFVKIADAADRDKLIELAAEHQYAALVNPERVQSAAA